MDGHNTYSYRWRCNFSCFNSIFLSFLDKCEINNILRTVLTGAVWFIGFGMRGMANMFINDMRNTMPTLFALMGVRTFILFFSIPVSTLKSEPLNNVSWIKNK